MQYFDWFVTIVDGLNVRDKWGCAILFNQESTAIKRNLTAILIGRRHLVGAGAYAAACEIIVRPGANREEHDLASIRRIARASHWFSIILNGPASDTHPPRNRTTKMSADRCAPLYLLLLARDNSMDHRLSFGAHWIALIRRNWSGWLVEMARM